MTADCGIYKIENMIDGKSYIGQSYRLTYRLKCHESVLEQDIEHGNRHLRNAVNKYGIENFSFKVILYCEEFELLRYEDALIECDRPNRYNIRPAANSNKGVKFCAETLRRMSESLKGRTAWNKGKKLDLPAETRRKMSEARKGKPAWNKGKKLPGASEETKHKMSVSHTGLTASAETKLKLSVSKTGFVVSEESKRKNRVAHIGKVMSADALHNMSVAQTGHVGWNAGKRHSDATKKKMSDSQKRRRLAEQDVWECT